MISVILPAYNTPDAYLREAIESVLAQTYLDWELLVIDDSTTAPVEGIVKCYSDSRIRYFRNEKNLGMANSRNRGIELAKGEFIALLDHDDVWLPKKLEIQIKLLQNQPHIGLVYSPVIFLTDEGNSIQQCRKDDTLDNLLRENLIYSCSTVLIRRSILTKHSLKFRDKTVPIDDYDMWLRFAIHSEFTRIESPLIRYRKHRQNASNNLSAINKKGVLIFLYFIPEIALSKFNLLQKIKLSVCALRSSFYVLRNRVLTHRDVRLQKNNFF